MLAIPQIETQTIESTSRKSLAETHASSRLEECCPSCDSKTAKINLYSCCLAMFCSSCYSGFHYLECPSKCRASPSSSSSNVAKQKKQCQRCEQAINQNYIICKQCRNLHLCQSCFDQTHASPKFQLHNYKKYNFHNNLHQQQNILLCGVHKKIRNILTQSAQLVCNDCVTNFKLKKFKCIDFQSSTNIQLIQKQVTGLVQQLKRKEESHSTKWKKLRHQLTTQYNKLYEIIKQKFDHNMQALNQMQQYDMRAINKAMAESKKIIKQNSLDFNQLSIPNNLIFAKMNMLVCQLSQHRQNIQTSQLYVYKIVQFEYEKMQNLMKNFSIAKLKLREPDEKENQSLRKSINKPNANNLSLSRRSLQKSVSKQDHIKQDMRGSIVIQKSQNMSHQQLSTIRNSTPPHSYKNPVNSSDKKSTLMRQSSIMSAKLQDITPVILNFDSKETNCNRINFLSSKTEDEQNLTDATQSRQSKRKSDFFDLRDRMRKPSMNSIMGNRFAKR